MTDVHLRLVKSKQLQIRSLAVITPLKRLHAGVLLIQVMIFY
jgi:hypothetical protein